MKKGEALIQATPEQMLNAIRIVVTLAVMTYGASLNEDQFERMMNIVTQAIEYPFKHPTGSIVELTETLCETFPATCEP